jgi:hypothetical protein
MPRLRIVLIVGSLVPLVLLTIAVAAKPGDAVSPHAAPVVTGWEIVAADTALQNVNVQIGVVACPMGKQVLGGGYLMQHPTMPIGSDLRRVAVVDNHPFPPTSAADGWRVRAIRLSPSIGAWQMRVYAICAFATP